MNKQLIVYLVSFVLLGLVGFLVHTFLLDEAIGYTLSNVYVFHALFSLVLCASFSVLSQSSKWNDQLGFLYLASVALKIILFSVVFYRQVFSVNPFTKAEGAGLVLPMVLFLVLEVFFISKLLNKGASKKNE